MKRKLIYLDHASTTPLTKNVLNDINSANIKYWGNVSSTHKFGIECSTKLEKVRNEIASIFNAKTENIIFTSGATESIAIVFSSLEYFSKPYSIITSKLEHQATNIALRKYMKQGWEVSMLPLDNQGIVKKELLDNYFNEKVKLVSVIWGQSEIGTVQPILSIGKKCKLYNVPFHIDATQIISNGIFDWKELNCDFLSLSAHKFGGPKGIGILITNIDSSKLIRNEEISLTQEYSIRAGTQPLPLIIGMLTALKNIKNKIIIKDDITIFKSKKLNILQKYMLDKFIDNSNIEIIGSIKNRLPNHLSFILLNKDREPIKAFKIINFMSENGIAISSGSACSSSSKKPSIALYNIGIEEQKLYSNIRISFSNDNTFEELDIFYNLLLECIDIF